MSSGNITMVFEIVFAVSGIDVAGLVERNRQYRSRACLCMVESESQHKWIGGPYY